MDNFRDGIIQLKLTDQIKTILKQYPDDGQILKEIIQNAEDAQAATVKFFIDDAKYSTGNLFSNDMEKFQGPALLTFNDGVFKENDWESIRMIYQSKKEKDSLKIGRFGLGFKSVFHITDLPSFISGPCIAYLDPHENLFYNEDSQEFTSSYIFNVKKHKEEMSQMLNQWLPFEHETTNFNYSTFEREENYPGTLFRFPLRVNARHSKISNTIYTPEKLFDFYESIKREGPLSLLFLKFVESIELYAKEGNSMALHYEIKMTQGCLENVRRKKEIFLAGVRAKEECSAVYLLELESNLWENNAIRETKMYRYLVCHYHANPSPNSHLFQLAKKQDILPLVGLAYPLSDGNTTSNSELVESQVFCFLPLPFEETDCTGLKFHVNGYFAVDSNRRHLKWPIQGEKKISDEAKWNRTLIDELMPKALITMILEGITIQEFTPEQIYRMFPDSELVKENWRQLVQKFYEMIVYKPAIFCESSEGASWENFSKCFIFNSRWSHELIQFSSKILLNDNKSCAKFPKHIHTALARYCPKDFNKKEVTLSDVCKSFKRVQKNQNWSDQERMLLLSAIIDSSSSHKLLKGLDLIPLLNGQWIPLKKPNDDQFVYIENHNHVRTLLYGNNEHLFVNSDLLTSYIQEEKMEEICSAYQLRYFDKNSFMKEFFKLKLSESLKFDLAWMKCLWKYLRKFFKEDLGKFSAKHAPPILPINSVEVVKLPSVKDAVILGHYGEFLLSENEKKLLKSLDIRIIDEVSQCALKHKSIGEFLTIPHLEGKLSVILKRMMHYDKKGAINVINSLQIPMKRQLRMILNEIDKAFLSKCAILSDLPIFETISPSSGGGQNRFISAKQAKGCTTASDRYVLSLPDSIICSDESSCKLLKLLEVTFYSVDDLMFQILKLHFPNGNLKQSTDPIAAAQFALKCLQNTKKHSNIYKYLENTSFVQTKSRGLKKPRELFDQLDEINKLLFSDEYFPSGLFQNESSLHYLRQLGLRNSDKITKEEMITICFALKDKENILSISEVLLTYFERNNNLWLSLKEDLKHCEFLPICRVKPENYPSKLAWKGCDVNIEFLSRTRPLSCASICGSTSSCLSRKSSLELDRPTLTEVVCHLRSCLSVYKVEDKAEYLIMINEIYNYFNEFSADKLISELSSNNIVDWIFVGDTFAPADRCVFQSSMQLEPYVYIIPKEMQKFHRLFSKCGVQEKCDYESVLLQMKSYYDATEDYSHADRDKDYAISIINTILSGAESGQSFQDIPLPIVGDKLKFKMVKECAFCDSGFNQCDLSQTNADNPIYLVHFDIPPQKAKLLGVATLMSVLLSDEDLCWDTGFGQTVSLTDMLKNLLDDYRDGLSVVKEMIQNADDAQATVVKFLYDERENDSCKKSLFDETMKSLQGPAFLIYNDAKFTDDDFNNICKVGGATKELVADKIGRFGYGFNSVYNLTEAPSFISDKSIVFFDPQKKYLGQALRNQQQPGIRLKLDRPSVKNQLLILKDQFQPFDGIFDCHLGQESCLDSYSGTLFRLPLRTSEQARYSSICKKSYTHEDILYLIKALYDHKHEILLFTQHVERIEVYHLLDNEESSVEKMKKLFVIAKSIKESFDSLPGGGQNILKVKPDQIPIQTQRSTSNLIRSSSLIQSECIMESDLCGDIDIKNNQQDQRRHFMLCSTLRLDKEQQQVTSLLVGGVAVELNSDSLAPQCLDRSLMFCFLPLPRQIDLPFHINGYFYISSNRTEVYAKDIHDKDNEKFQWNRTLIEKPVLDSYMHCLELIKKNCSNRAALGSSWYSIWPVTTEKTIEGKENLIWHFTESFYSTVMKTTSWQLFIGVDKWSSFSNSIFLDPKYLKSPIRSVLQRVFTKISSEKLKDKNVITLPERIVDLLSTYNKKDLIMRQMYTQEKFLIELVLPNCKNISPKDYDTILIYTLHELDTRNMDDKIIKAIQSTDCLPTLGHRDSFIRPRKLIDERSYLAKLYCKEDGRFLRWSPSHMHKVFEELKIREPNIKMIFQNLLNLGMKAEDITWKELISRAKTIKDMDFQLGKNRASVLLEFVRKKIANDPDEEESSQLLSVPFMPIKKCPEKFPLKWHASSQSKFCSPKDGFLEEYQDLVCFSASVILSDEHLFSSRHSIDDVKSFLSLNWTDIPVDIVLKQLQCLLNAEKQTFTESSLFNMLYSIYEYLNNYIESGENIDLALNSRRCIIGIREFPNFLSPQQCCKRSESSFVPYLCGLPQYFLSRYKHLVDYLQIKEHFTEIDFISVLTKINKESNGKKLSDDKIRLCLHIITELCQLIDENQTDLKALWPIYLPNRACEMREISLLCYQNTNSWMEAEDTNNLIHQNISPGHSKSLGVKTLEEEVLRERQIGIPFGQSEKLTNRIKRLLSGYPFDESILKELLQNADDANASEIYFILDKRHHSCEKIFRDHWKPMQGPALLVYNNKGFTSADIEGIQKLGEGSKRGDSWKTGQYGVGFNCVYHLTNVPTFLTVIDDERSLCVFDPLCKYVTGSCDTSPGQRFTDLANLEKKFPSVFSCYEIDTIQVDKNRPGTLFRLPLRSEDNIDASTKLLIDHPKPITPETVEYLFEGFLRDIDKCLLFMNNVKTVKFFSISESGKLNLKSSVTATVSNNFTQGLHQFNNRVDSEGKSFENHKTISQVKSTSIIYEMTVTCKREDMDNQEEIKKWVISQQFGFNHPADISPSIVEKCKDGSLVLSPKGGVALETTYIPKTSDCSRHNIFCLMPLPIDTELAVHINGHFGLEYETRRNLAPMKNSSILSEWNRLLIKSAIVPAYASLILFIRRKFSPLKDIIALLMYQDWYYSLFPQMGAYNEHGNDMYLTYLTREFYAYIHSSNDGFFPMIREKEKTASISWHPAFSSDPQTKTYFHKFEGDYENNQDSDQNNLIKTLQRWGMIVVDTPAKVLDNFQNFTPPLDKISPESVVCQLKTSTITVFPREIHNTPYLTKEMFHLVFCYVVNNLTDQLTGGGEKEKRELTEKYQNLLQASPLLITADSFIRRFDSNGKIFSSKFFYLISQCPHRFLHELVLDIHSPILNLNIIKFTVKDFADLLEYELPKNDFSGPELKVRYELLSNIVGRSWLRNMWKFLSIDMSSNENVCKYLEPLNEWHLLPVRDNDKEWFLIPIRHSCSVIDLSDNTYRSHNNRLFSYLSKLEIYQPNFQPLMKKFVIEGEKVFKKEGKACQSFEKSLGSASNSEHVFNALKILPEDKLAGVMQESHDYRKICRAIISSYLNLLPFQTSSLDSFATGICENKLSCIKFFNKKNKILISQAFEKCLADNEATSENLHDILSAFVKTMKNFHQEFIREAESLNDVLCKKTFQPADLGTVLNIPMFVDVCGNVLALNHIKQRFYLSDNHMSMPTIDLDNWISPTDTGTETVVFLRYAATPKLQNLYKFVACQPIDLADMYLQIIFPRFHSMSDDAQYQHLIYLRDLFRNTYQWKLIRKTDELISKLKQLAFIKDEIISDSKHTVDYFYNPEIPVFKSMYPERLLPKTYGSEWIDFFCALNLITKVDDDKIVELATKIAESAQIDPDDETIREKSIELLKVFYCQESTSTDFLDKMKTIPFLPAYIRDDDSFVLSYNYGKVKPNTHYIFFFGATFEDKFQLIWTQKHVLPKDIHPSKWNKNNSVNDLLLKLGVIIEPDLETICQHLLCLCDNWDEGSYISLMEHIQPVFKHLSAIKDLASHSKQLEILKMNRIIPLEDGKTLIKPCHTITQELLAEDEIKPYLCRLPLAFGPFESFFLTIGAQKTPSLSSYIEVLNNFKKEFSSGIEFSSCQIEKAFSDLIKCSSKTATVPSDQPIYLPGCDQKLHLSETLIYVDFTLRSRAKHVEKPLLDSMTVTEHKVEEFIEKLPNDRKPLINVVVEKINKKTVLTKLDSAEPICKEVLCKINDFDFIYGVLRLAFHHIDDIEQITIDQIMTSLSHLEIMVVSELSTVIQFIGNSVEGSETSKNVFLDRDENWILLLNSAPSNEMIFCNEVIVCLLKLIGLDLDTMSMYMMLKSDNVDKILDEMKIKQLPEKFLQMKPLFTIGDYIRLDMYDLMIQDCLVVLKKGEFVAFESIDASDQNADSEFTFAKCLEIFEPSSDTSFVKSLKIYLGDGKEFNVNSLYLYKLKRIPLAKETSCDLNLDQKVQDYDMELKKAEIKQLLTRSNKLSSSLLRQLIKRLLLQWHPDRNPNDVARCTEMYDFIRTIVKNLQNQEDHTHLVNNYFNMFNKGKHSGSNNPQPTAAKRWLKQAIADLEVAGNDDQPNLPKGYEWVGLKCHQAVEKALKAVQLATTGEKFSDHNLCNLCWDNDDVKVWCREIESIGSSVSFRYPDQHAGSIPHDCYTKTDADKIRSLATRVVDAAKDRVATA